MSSLGFQTQLLGALLVSWIWYFFSYFEWAARDPDEYFHMVICMDLVFEDSHLLIEHVSYNFLEHLLLVDTIYRYGPLDAG